MIKAISTNPIRKTAMALLVTAPLMLGACKSGNNNNSVQQNQTEVISKAGSDALKAQTILESRLKEPLYSYEANIKIQNKAHLYDDTDEMKEQTNIIINKVKDFGMFNSTAILQLYTDGMGFGNAIDNFTMAHKDFDKVDKYNDSIMTWDSNVRHKNGMPKLVSGEVTSAQECSKFCDEYLKMFDFVTEEDIKDYEKSVGEFIAKQKDLGSAQQMADLISYKIFKADSIIYKRLLNKYPVFEEPSPNGRFGNMSEYFEHDFVERARPEP